MPLPKKIPRGRRSSKEEEEEKRILANRYQVERKLGSGNFGTAFLVKDLKCKDPKDPEQWKVMKEIPVGDLQPDETVDAMHEANLLSKLDHPSIVKFYDSFLDGEFFCIVTEYCDGGDLEDQIIKYRKEGKALDEILVMDWFVQLLLAVQYMHSRRVLHRDLKTRNIFLRNNMVKIGDFGISRILMGTSDMASTFTGTPYYMSPEVLKHEGYNSKSDVWSIGCILYELCALQHAFEGQSLMGVMYKIVEGTSPQLPDKYCKELQGVLKLMLVKEPEKRPSATELTKVPFVHRHIEKLKNTIQVKHKKDMQEKEGHRKEAEEIDNLLRKKTHLQTLRDSEEDVKWKNLSPRERMRIRKQQKADEEKKKLEEAVRQSYEETQLKKDQIKSSFLTSNAGALLGGRATRPNNVQVHQLRSADIAYNSRPQTAPETQREEKEEEFDVAEAMLNPGAQTMVPKQLHVIVEDERPITPMKDKLVYDIKNSSLDWKDGIPDQPAAADTFYSQYEDFEDLEEVDEEIEGEAEDEDELGQTAEDVEHLIGYMENALDTTAEKSVTFADDSVAGAFGPVVRDVKIKNLRMDCEKKLGKNAFQKAYNYLKSARFGDMAGTVDENEIIAGLRQYVKNPSDCFLVDQLLFLEEQAKVAKM
ncbi:serine/threonine-protein kinase Nek11 [Lingula anatina]|uniref:non-specific serine/threonine protein kinase n=1 Tax=Lingula anatina TaxID=7574 RepID=A0A1S3JN97_LINAN|nr:serine/threonine-protein kinase Nek11 [Lingula anatina]|eukprot:XP_013411835.1 serine/threonine-protein kinase Nek11 [Lingula anatina]